MKKLIIISVLLLVVASSMCIGGEEETGTYEAYYYGTEFLFNSDLDIARNVTVEPSENTLENTIFGYTVTGLHFVYYDNPEEIPFYTKSLISFVSKYQKMSLLVWDYSIENNMNITTINSTDQIPNGTMYEPVILMLGPEHSDSNKIEVDGYIIKVYAKDLTPREGKYAQFTDFDLAMDKIIMVLMVK